MTIHLPEELKRFVLDQVRAGRYRTKDDMTCDALEKLRQDVVSPARGLGSIGAVREDAELLEQVTQDIMESRRTRTLRLTPDE